MTNYSEMYDSYWRRPDRMGESSFDDPAPIAGRILAASGPGRILDVGCGMGSLVREMLRRGANAYGIDVSPVAAATCHQHSPGRFFSGSVLALPLPNESFDTLVSTDCLEHLAPEDIGPALLEMRRVCRRNLFLYVATKQDRDGHWHLTVEKRNWWENAAFAAGFRKHPHYYLFTPFEALETEGNCIAIPLEKIPDQVLNQYPLTALVAQRDLHMDMSRETGRRSDAHMARYQLASNYIRDGDTVLDAACGMGYGSWLLGRASNAGKVIGADLDQDAILYATANFAPPLGDRLAFQQTDAQDLSFLADNSIDVLVSFETLEHVPAPTRIISEARRVLRPGGRLIVSVPNLWVDASGRDPNPFHLHVYDWSRLKHEISAAFLIEAAFTQIAGGGMKLHDHPRCLQPVSVTGEPDADAEWWLMVAMKDPVGGQVVPYQETALAWNGNPPNIAAFARDYQNPWLVRSMVSIGWRITNEHLLAQIAEQVRSSGLGRVDEGAALCVLAYRALHSRDQLLPGTQAHLVDSIDRYVEHWDKANPHETRWVISNLYVKACLLRNSGDRAGALSAFDQCAAIDPLLYSPLLATKTVSSCWLAGLLSFHDQNLDAARNFWSRGILLAEQALKGSWREIYGATDRPFTFGLKEAGEVLNTAAQCADALNHTAIHGNSKGLPATATVGHLQQLIECEKQLSVARENLDKILASPGSRLQRAMTQDAPSLRRLVRVPYLLAVILLPSSVKRLLRPMARPFKRWFDNRTQ